MLKAHKFLVTILPIFLLFSFCLQLQMETLAHAENSIFDLTEACMQGDLKTVKRLLAEGMDVNAKAGSQSPIVEAAGGGHLKLVQLLLDKGADINSRGGQDTTPLIIASGGGHLEVVKLLFSKKADINAKNIYGKTALLEASWQGRLEVVKFLLEKGADALIVDQKGHNAFLLACDLGQLAVAKYLLKHVPGIQYQQNQLNDILINLSASNRNSLEMMKFMTGLGADVNARSKDRFGWNGLICASMGGRADAVRFLLKKGANVNAVDNYGNTALMSAAKYGTDIDEVVRVLLENGASLEQKNFTGDTALVMAKDEKIAKLIKSYGAKSPVILTPANFDLYHSLPYDKRFSKGLELSFRQYYRLFTLRPGASISVKTTSVNLDARHYRIIYKVNVQDALETYEVILSNQASDVHKNLEALRKVLLDFSERRQNIQKKFSNRQSDYDALKNELVELIYTFDYTDLFNSLQLIDQHITSGKSGPKSLLFASEVYSWLAFFKNRNQNRHLSDTLATYGVCNYLLGCLQSTPEESRSFSKGLLLLSLDYPSAALESFRRNSATDQLLTAYIRNEFEIFKSLQRNPLISDRLLGYLEARAYKSSNQHNIAQSKFDILMLNYPGFLMAKEYVLDNADVGFIRMLIQPYFEELLDKHQDILEKHTQTEWISNDKELGELIKKEVSETSRLPKWLKIHKTMVNQTSVLKDISAVIDVDFLKIFLLEDVTNALVIYHRFESERLGREAETAAIVDMIKSIYPENILSSVIFLKNDQYRDRILQKVRNSKTDSESRYLIRKVFNTNALSFREGIELLNIYREIENPDSIGLYRMYELHKGIFFDSVAIRSLKEAIAADPYNYLFYEKAFDTKEGRLYIEQGKKHAGEIYGFLTALGAWYYKNGNEKEAITSYEAAIRKSPNQQSAYMKLGEIYFNQKQYKEAIGTWQEYLKYDDRTLSAVEIKNSIGKTLLEMGESSKAYDILMESKKSWQGNALVGFAEASEKTGRIMQAEEYFKIAAERYPTGAAPHLLGLFYLRQGHIDTACQIFKEYKRYQYEQNYIYYLSEHFIKKGSPEGAVEVIKKVEGKSSSKIKQCIERLAKFYASKGQYKNAMELIEPLILEENCTWLAGDYINYSRVGKTGNPDKVISKLKKGDSIAEPYFVSNIANQFMNNGLFDEALPFLIGFLKKVDISGDSRKRAFINAALAWRMSNGNQKTKEEIRSYIKYFEKDTWVVSCAMFLIKEIDEKTILSRAGTQRQYSEIYYYLAEIKNKEGKRDEVLYYPLIYLETMNDSEMYYGRAYELAKQYAS